MDLNNISNEKQKMIQDAFNEEVFEAYFEAPKKPFLQSNGQPAVVALSMEHAAQLFRFYDNRDVKTEDIAIVDELSPKDRYPEIVEAMKYGLLWQISC